MISLDAKPLFVALMVLPTLVWALLSGAELHARVMLNSSLSVSETYTDNLFFEPKADKRDDFGTFIIPSLTLSYESRDVLLSGTYTGVAQFYVNNPSANAYSHNANFGIDLPFLTKRYKGLEVQLIESLNFSPQLDGFAFSGNPEDQDSALTQQSQNQPLGVTQGGGFGQTGGFSSNAIGNRGVVTGRSTNAFQNRAGVRLRYAFSPRWSTSASYINRYTVFTDSDLNDNISHTLGGGLGYAISPRTNVNGSYFATINHIDGGDTVISHNFFGGVGHTFSPTVSMNINAGVSFTESVERVNFVSNSFITKSFDPGSIRLGYTQNITSGGGLGTSGVLSQRGVLSGSYPLAERLSGFVQAGAAQNTSLSGNEVDVRTYQGQAGLSMQFLRWLSGSASYSYIKQKSKGTAVGGRTASAHQGFVGLTARLPEWRILD